MSFGKAFGKMKQVMGEKIGTTKKSEYPEDFRERELITEGKKDAIIRLYTTTTNYINNLVKKDDKEKSVFQEALGTVMRQSGQKMTDSGYGNSSLELKLKIMINKGKSLVVVGDALVNVGTSQVDFVVQVKQGFYEHLERANADMLEYKHLRKTLENRRIEYDAKSNKLQSAKKESPEMEEDVRQAKVKYEEALQDVEIKMQQVSEGEEVLQVDLVSFVDAQIEWFKKGLQYLERAASELKEIPTSAPSTFSDYPNRKVSLAASHLSRAESVSTVKSKSTPAPPPPRKKTAAPGGSDDPRKLVRVEFEYDAEDEGELTIKEGDFIRVVEEIDEGWWIGEAEDGRTGMFPANYVKAVAVEPEPSRVSISKPLITRTKVPEPVAVVEEEEAPPSYMAPSGRRIPGIPSTASSSVAVPARNFAPPPRPSSSSKPNTQPNTQNAPPPTMQDYMAQQAVDYAVKHPKEAMHAMGALAGFGAKVGASAYKAQASSGSKPAAAAKACGECGCEEFQLNMFKKDYCNNCFHKH